jgi:signal transduction histidine kinase
MTESDAAGATTLERSAHPRPDAAPLRLVELVVIAIVWLFFGALNVATEVLERHHDISPAEALGDASPRIFINPVLWALVTTLVLWLGRRVTLDRAFWRRYGVGVALGAVLGANLVDLVSDTAWDALAPRAVVRREHEHDHDRREPRRFRPGPRDLRWLDDFAVMLAALAAASARGYLLRERARREDARRREAQLQAESARVRADAAQLHAQLAEARLDALRRQLDPHVLFNTLNAVSALVERDPRGVRRMIGQLSDLLRHSMDGASSPEIPLRDELELLARYVDIMRVRFEDQLEVETGADPRALDALVPNMILQPLVENAIKHGVAPRGEEGPVEVGASLEGDPLVLSVRDDGPGMPPWSPSAIDDEPIGARGGVGLRNTAARLAQLYGPAHRFTVGPAAGGGTLVEIRLPYHTRSAVPDGGTTRGG